MTPRAVAALLAVACAPPPEVPLTPYDPLDPAHAPATAPSEPVVDTGVEPPPAWGRVQRCAPQLLPLEPKAEDAQQWWHFYSDHYTFCSLGDYRTHANPEEYAPGAVVAHIVRYRHDSTGAANCADLWRIDIEGIPPDELPAALQPPVGTTWWFEITDYTLVESINADENSCSPGYYPLPGEFMAIRRIEGQSQMYGGGRGGSVKPAEGGPWEILIQDRYNGRWEWFPGNYSTIDRLHIRETGFGYDSRWDIEVDH